MPNPPSKAIIFDDGKGDLSPLTNLRPPCAIRTGALTTRERSALLLDAFADAEIVGVHVTHDMVDLAAEQTDLPVNDSRSIEGDTLCINARCVILPEEIEDLGVGNALLDESGAVIAASLIAGDAAKLLESGELPSATKTSTIRDAAMLRHPWDVIRYRDEAIAIDLTHLVRGETQALPPGVIAIDNGENICISPEAVVYPGVTLDAESGPIVIDDDATIRPGAVIVGPAYIGRGSTVIDRTFIKANTSIGPVCKVAGEVGGCIFQGFANKAHDGHLGDSFIGEWVNLGAGTTNSNLLNTYAEVVAQNHPKGKRHRTGIVYLGCILGDHAKFAICSRIMTGCVVGTGSMFAATAPCSGATGAMRWITDAGEHPYRLDKFLDVAKTVMARRERAVTEAYLAALQRLAD